MQILAGISVAVLILAALLISIFKGSRPPQPIPSTPTSPMRAKFAAFMFLVCVVILLVTLFKIGPWAGEHLARPLPLIILFVGVIAPWFVGIYSAYKAACAGNKVIRALGASGVLIFCWQRR
jgi:cytochrome b561